MIGLDIESNGLGYRDPATFVIHMVGFDNGETVAIATQQEAIAARLRACTALVGHNAIAFDQPALEAVLGPFPFIFDDTMLLAYLADESWHHYDLQTCAQHYLGVPPWKDDVTWKWSEFANASEDERQRAYRYNARDARYARRLYTTFQQRLDAKQWNLYENLLKPAARALQQIHVNGVPICRETLDQQIGEVEIEIEQSRDELLKAAEPFGFKKFNPNSHPQIRTLLYDHLGFETGRTTGTGAPSTDEETINALRVDNDDPILEALLRYRAATKKMGTYLLPYRTKWIEGDGRVHPSYSLLKVTGRTSARDPNIQQLPRDRTRQIVRARPGFKLIIADLSQAELRTMAYLSREPNLMAIYQQSLFGGDVHSVMAQRIATMRGESTFTKEDRTLAKPVNFGCLYGAEPFTLQSTALKDYGIRLTYEQAAFLRDDVFFDMFSGLPVYYDAILDELKTRGAVHSPLGRRRALPNIKARDASLREAALREGINTPNQGFASDIALMGVIKLVELYPQYVIAFVHDAALLECPDAEAEAVAEAVRTAMVLHPPQYMEQFFNLQFDIPIACDITISQEWK